MNKMLVDVVLPVYNEEHVLEKSVKKLIEFLSENLKEYRWRITIGDNASTDGTLEVANKLAETNEKIRVVHIPYKGRGRMVKFVWNNSDADILTYMDIDLSTDLRAFPPLVDAIRDGYDIAIGSRQHKDSYVERSFKRSIISIGYIAILKVMLNFPFSDAQCGFKAISKKAAKELLPLVKDNEWFFDTELLYIAYVEGYKVKEIPVKWIEDKDSRVRIIRTAWLDMKGVFRMMKYKPKRLKNE